MLILTANLINIALIVHIYGPMELTYFFSNWAVCVNCIFFGIAIAASKYQLNFSLLAWHHMLFELSLIMNFIVVTVFWSVLAEGAFKKYQGNFMKILNSYWTHIVPALSVDINFTISDVTMKAKHGLVVPIPALMYGYVNYVETKARKAPIYWFLTWEDY